MADQVSLPADFATQVVKIVKQYLEQNPITHVDTLNVDQLVVKSQLTLADQVSFPNQDWRYIGSQGNPAFDNSWAAYGAPYANPAFMVSPDGWVQLHGVIASGTLAASAFTLPPGFRPTAPVAFTVLSNGAAGRVDVGSDGTVTPLSPSTNASVVLDHVRFRAA